MGLAKTTPPKALGSLRRPRLFRALDRTGHVPVTWVWGPPGAGKTTVVAAYLARTVRSLWYHVDEGDEDLASFFYYLREANPKRNPPLPLLTPEYLAGLPVFARRFFRQLFGGLRAPFADAMATLTVKQFHAPLAEVGTQFA